MKNKIMYQIQQMLYFLKAVKAYFDFKIAMREGQIDMAVCHENGLNVYNLCLDKANQLRLWRLLDTDPEDVHQLIVEAVVRRYHDLQQAAHESNIDRIKFESFSRYIEIYHFHVKEQS